MSLLDAFLLEFEANGLDELKDDVVDADKKLDKFEEQTKKTENQIKDMGKAIQKNGAAQFKNMAISAAKAVAPMVILGKALFQTMKFASDALEVAEAATKAKMTLEQFQLQEGNKYAIFTKEDVNNAKDFEMTMRDIRMGLASIGANVSRMILPGLTALAKIAKKVVDFFVGHATFIKIIAGLVAIGGGLFGLSKIIRGVLSPAVKKLGVQLWSALAPVLVPILAIGAAIAGLALIIEDLIVWVNGGESAFGDLWDEIFGGVEGAKELFNQFMSVLNELWELAQPILKGIADLILKGIFYALKGVVTVLAAVAKGIKALTGKNVDVNVNTKENVDGSHADGLDYVPYDGYIAELHRGERVQTADEAKDWRSGLIAAKKAIDFTANYPLNAIPTGAMTNATNNYNNSTSNPTININGVTIQTQATDAQGIAQDFSTYIKQAMMTLDDGMLA